jgi:N-acyl-D-amino-acid deacylase
MKCKRLSMLDLALKGARVVDGTAAPRFQADIGIRDGRIVEIGTLSEQAARTIDGHGAIAAPRFADVHAHYDTQAFWDGTLSPSPLQFPFKSA